MDTSSKLPKKLPQEKTKETTKKNILKKLTQVRLPENLKTRAEEEAQRKGLDLSKYLIHLLATDIDIYHTIFPYFRLKADHVITVTKNGDFITEITKELHLNTDMNLFHYANLFSLEKATHFTKNSSGKDAKESWVALGIDKGEKLYGNKKDLHQEDNEQRIKIMLINKDGQGNEIPIIGRSIKEAYHLSGAYKEVELPNQPIGQNVRLKIKHTIKDYSFRQTYDQYIENGSEKDGVSFLVDVGTDQFTLEVRLEKGLFKETLNKTSADMKSILGSINHHVLLVRSIKDSVMLHPEKAEFGAYERHKIIKLFNKIEQYNEEDYFTYKILVERPILGAAYRVSWMCSLKS